MHQEIFKINDLTTRYQVNKSTISRWFERGTISYYSVGNRRSGRRIIWFDWKQINAFENLHLVPAINMPLAEQGEVVRNEVMVKPCELADRYQVHLSTVLRWCNQGLITHLNLTLLSGGKRTVRFNHDHIAEFEKQCLTPTEITYLIR